MEYVSHIWGGSIHTALLEKVDSRVFRLINSSALTNCLQSLSACRTVASLSLYYRYYNGHCSTELSCRIPPPLRRARATLLLHSLFLSLSNSLTPDVTDVLIFTCTLLVKSGTHSLHLFSQ